MFACSSSGSTRRNSRQEESKLCSNTTGGAELFSVDVLMKVASIGAAAIAGGSVSEADVTLFAAAIAAGSSSSRMEYCWVMESVGFVAREGLVGASQPVVARRRASIGDCARPTQHHERAIAVVDRLTRST